MSADPRGPHRKIVEVAPRNHGTFLKLSCGHVGKFNQTFSYRVGDDCRCFRCGPHGSESWVPVETMPEADAS